MEVARPNHWRLSRIVPVCFVLVGVVLAQGGRTGPASPAMNASIHERTVMFAFSDLHSNEARVDGAKRGGDLRGGAQPGTTLRWPAGSRVGFVINPAGAPAHASEALSDAAATWTTAGDVGIEIVREGTTEQRGAQTDLVNVVSWVNTDNPSDTFVARTITYWYADEPDVLIAFDMMFNLDHQFTVAGGSDSDGDGTGDGEAWDVETVALHEFGHALGLSHTPPERVMRVMRPTLAPGAIQRSPAVRDIEALADLYGVEPARPTVGFFERSLPDLADERRDGIFVGPRELVPTAPNGPGLFG